MTRSTAEMDIVYENLRDGAVIVRDTVETDIAPRSSSKVDIAVPPLGEGEYHLPIYAFTRSDCGVIPDRQRVFLYVDLARRGLGGDDSWGAAPHDPYRLTRREYDFSLYMRAAH